MRNDLSSPPQESQKRVLFLKSPRQEKISKKIQCSFDEPIKRNAKKKGLSCDDVSVIMRAVAGRLTGGERQTENGWWWWGETRVGYIT